MGRPSKFTLKLTGEICARLSDGESLKSICDEEGMPKRATVFRWLAAHQSFRDMYARAREAQADCLADEILDIADEAMNDTYVDSEGVTRTDNEVIQRSKLRVDARKWIAAKLKPRVYGEKVHQELTGPNGTPLPAAGAAQVTVYLPQKNPPPSSEGAPT